MVTIKSRREISYIRRACAITTACYRFIIKRIRPGISERYVAEQIDTFIKKRNAITAFPPIVAFGTNTSFVHHRKPSTYMRCRKQEIVLLDFGAKINGYCSDMTRMIFIGKPRQEWRGAYDVVYNTQQTIIHKISQEFSGAEMDRYARSMIEQSGFPPYPHSLGHNLGAEIHEPPKLSRKNDAQIIHGMVFTIEPGTYIKGKFGIRIEDTVVLKKNGIEVLTHAPK